MGVEEPFRGILVGQLERQGDLHVTTCESGIPVQQWRRLRFSYGDHGQIVAYDAADTKVVSLTSDGSIYVHSVFDLEPLQLIQSNLVLNCVCLSQDSHRYISCGSNLGEIHVWNAFNSQRYTSYKAHEEAVKRVAINNDDSYAASCSEHNLVFYSLILSKIVHEVSHAAITNLVFSPLRKYLICATDDSGSIVIYDVKSKGVVVKFVNVHAAPVTGAAFSPTNKVFFVTCGLDRFVSFFDIGAKLKIATRIQTEAPLTAVQFAPNGASIVLTDSLFQTTVYDLRSTSQPLLKFSGAFTRLLKYVTLPIHQATELSASAIADTPGAASISSSFFSPIRSSKTTSSPELVQSSAPALASMSSMFSPLRSTVDYKALEKPIISRGEQIASDKPSREEYSSSTASISDLNRKEIEGDDLRDNRENMSLLMKGSSLFSPVQSRMNSEFSLARDSRREKQKPALNNLPQKIGYSESLSGEYRDDVAYKSEDAHEGVNPTILSNDDREPVQRSAVFEKKSPEKLSSPMSMMASDEDQPMPVKVTPNESKRTSPVSVENVFGLNRADDIICKDQDGVYKDARTLNSEAAAASKLSLSTEQPEELPEQSEPADSSKPPVFPLQTFNQSVPPSGVSIQAEVIRSALDEPIVAIRNDIRNLHLDMIRYFHGQKMELAAQFNAELDHLRHELAQTVADNHKLRQQIARFGSFPKSE